jgi:hypothetical protein
MLEVLLLITKLQADPNLPNPDIRPHETKPSRVVVAKPKEGEPQDCDYRGCPRREQ